MTGRVRSVKATAVKPGDYVLNHEGAAMKVLASYMDGHGPGASWCIEGYVQGKPTSRIRGGSETMIDVLDSAPR